MVAKKDEPLTLVDGSYDGGKIVVTDGNHLSINNPTQHIRNIIPLSKKVKINSGDVIQFKAGGTNATLKARYYGVVIDGQNYVSGENKPDRNMWYSIAGTGSGSMTDVSVMTTEVGWIAEIDFSLKINGEVIL